MSLIITAYATVVDIRRTWTPELKKVHDETVLVLIDLGMGKKRLGGSILAQTFSQVGKEVADLVDVPALGAFFKAMQRLRTPKEEDGTNVVLAYHDRSDGGLITTAVEMGFAGRAGVTLTLTDNDDIYGSLFNEELGAVVQVRRKDYPLVCKVLEEEGFPMAARHCSIVGVVDPSSLDFIVRTQGTTATAIAIATTATVLYRSTITEMQRIWAETSYRMQALRDNEQCARDEFDRLLDIDDPGLHYHLTFDPAEYEVSPYMELALLQRPAVAILREQGVNGQVEMAQAFHRSGFRTVDVHMSDILAGKISLSEFKGMSFFS